MFMSVTRFFCQKCDVYYQPGDHECYAETMQKPKVKKPCMMTIHQREDIAREVCQENYKDSKLYAKA